MRITRLTVRNLRNLEPVELQPGPGLNLITGANGAGKSSLLEAIHLLAYGRSFRGRVRDGLIRTGSESLEVFAEWLEPAAAAVAPFEKGGNGGLAVNSEGTQGALPARIRKAGLRHQGQAWSGRLDGVAVSQLGDLCAALAALTFEPGSHTLVSGGSEARRRYLDWGLFHVERSEDGSDFLPLWRRYVRALKQRNALLKQRKGAEQLDAWDGELALAGELLDQRRLAYLERLQRHLWALSAELVPQLGEAEFRYQPGWRREQMPLADALLLVRERDLATGFTSVGPHRADWRIEHAARAGQEALSRGQAKLTALVALLAQAEDFAAHRGHWPVMLLDDLASELDQTHQARVLDRLLTSGVQVFVTQTSVPARQDTWPAGRVLFLVEQGAVVPLNATDQQ